MRVVFITECYHPIRNGVVNCIDLIKNELNQLGHEVTIIAPSLNNDHQKDLIQVPSFNISGNRGYHLCFPAFSRQAVQAIRECDVVHSHHPFTMGLWAQNLAKKYKKPFLLTNHTQYLTYVNIILGKFFNSPVKSYLKNFYKNCSNIVVPSQEIESQVKALINTPTVFIPNGINVRRFRQGNGSAVRFRLGIDQQEKVLLYVGRVSPEKSMISLLESLELVKHGFTLIVLGDGPDLPKAKSFVSKSSLKNRVHFVGSMPYGEVPDYFSASNIFVSCSTSEVYPLVMMEANAAGLPCVAPPAPGNSEIIESGITGFLRPAGAEFAQGVDSLLNNSRLLKSFSESALKKANQFSIQNSVTQLLKVYESVK